MADSNITKNALAVSMKKLMEKKAFFQNQRRRYLRGLRHEPEKAFIIISGTNMTW